MLDTEGVEQTENVRCFVRFRGEKTELFWMLLNRLF